MTGPIDPLSRSAHSRRQGRRAGDPPPDDVERSTLPMVVRYQLIGSLLRRRLPLVAWRLEVVITLGY